MGVFARLLQIVSSTFFFNIFSFAILYEIQSWEGPMGVVAHLLQRP